MSCFRHADMTTLLPQKQLWPESQLNGTCSLKPRSIVVTFTVNIIRYVCDTDYVSVCISRVNRKSSSKVTIKLIHLITSQITVFILNELVLPLLNVASLRALAVNQNWTFFRVVYFNKI